MPRSSDTPRVLVLGTGSIGSRHVGNLRSAGAAVTAIDPLDDERDWHGYDGIVVATPTGLHHEHATAALATGASVLVEKPLAATAAGLGELVKAAGDRLTVGYNLRLHAPVQRMRDLVAAGRMGTPISVRAWFGSYLPDWRPGADYRTSYSARRSLGGGILLDASHELDLLRWIMGPDWEVVGAVVEQRSHLDVDVEDTVTALLCTPQGLPAVVALDAVSRRYRRGLEVVGDEATLRLDWARGVIEVEDRHGVETEPATDPVDASYEREAVAFLDMCTGRGGPLVTAAEGAAVVELCDRIRAVATGTAP